MFRRPAALLPGLILLLAAPVAAAQTADGIGGRTGSPEPVGAAEASRSIDELLTMAEYQPRFYAVGFRSSAIAVPNFLLRPSFSEFTNTWGQGVRNFSYGGYFTTRIPDKFDVTVGLDWTSLRTPEGYWLERDEPVADAEYSINNLSLLGADVSVHWFTNLNRRQNLQFYYGFGLGLNVVLGQFNKFAVDTAACGWSAEERSSTDVELLRACAEARDSPRLPIEEREDRIPPVLPVIAITGGLRWLVSDNISLATEFGWKTAYGYAGLNLGYYWFARR